MTRRKCITAEELIEMAQQARSANPARDESDMARWQSQDHAARSFVSYLCGHLDHRFGKDAGNRFAVALGFDHLVEE